MFASQYRYWWQAEEAVHTTAGAANPLRSQVRQAFGDTAPPPVEVYEGNSHR